MYDASVLFPMLMCITECADRNTAQPSVSLPLRGVWQPSALVGVAVGGAT